VIPVSSFVVAVTAVRVHLWLLVSALQFRITENRHGVGARGSTVKPGAIRGVEHDRSGRTSESFERADVGNKLFFSLPNDLKYLNSQSKLREANLKGQFSLK